MISLAKMTKNKNKVLETSLTYSIFSQELLDFLGDDLFTAPASAFKDYYGCYPGGLVDHIIKVCKYALSVNETLPEKLRIDKAKIIKVSFLSQIGKTFLFKENPIEWERNKGNYYVYNQDFDISMRVGERSVFYCFKYGVTLEEDEYQTILNIDKPIDDNMVKWHSSILSNILKQGFELALIEEKHG